MTLRTVTVACALRARDTLVCILAPMIAASVNVVRASLTVEGPPGVLASRVTAPGRCCYPIGDERRPRSWFICASVPTSGFAPVSPRECSAGRGARGARRSARGTRGPLAAAGLGGREEDLHQALGGPPVQARRVGDVFDPAVHPRAALWAVAPREVSYVHDPRVSCSNRPRASVRAGPNCQRCRGSAGASTEAEAIGGQKRRNAKRTPAA